MRLTGLARLPAPPFFILAVLLGTSLAVGFAPARGYAQTQPAPAALQAMFTHYKEGRYTAAIAAGEQFITSYPGHAYNDYAGFLMGTSYLAQALTSDDADIATRAMHGAREAFSRLLRDFPQSPYAQAAQDRLKYIREQLAAADLAMAKEHLARGDAEGAAQAAQRVLNDYGPTAATDEARTVAIMAQRMKGGAKPDASSLEPSPGAGPLTFAHSAALAPQQPLPLEARRPELSEAAAPDIEAPAVVQPPAESTAAATVSAAETAPEVKVAPPATNPARSEAAPPSTMNPVPQTASAAPAQAAPAAQAVLPAATSGTALPSASVNSPAAAAGASPALRTSMSAPRLAMPSSPSREWKMEAKRGEEPRTAPIAAAPGPVPPLPGNPGAKSDASGIWNENWILGVDPAYYTVQLDVGENVENLREFIKANRLLGVALYRTSAGHHLVQGLYPNERTAQIAGDQLAKKLDLKSMSVWRVGDIQAEIRGVPAADASGVP